jgi:hypothetical protein
MAKDLELTGFRYNWLLTIFYISYILFNWLLLFWKKYPPHIVATVIVCSWYGTSYRQLAYSANFQSGV